MDRLLEDDHDPETPVAVIYHASWPDEDVIIGSIGDIADKVEEAGYRASALVVIGDAVTGAGYERSFLYGRLGESRIVFGECRRDGGQ